jgi:peptide-methionine (R)-S-oxide reductase
MENTVRIFNVKNKAIESVAKIEKTDAEWQRLLTRKQYEITTKNGTEAPGSREYTEIHEPGIFRCVRCGTDLFEKSAKFDSRTGWPSFYEPVSSLNVLEQPDYGFGTVRTEVLCARCGSHLGHVFDDGPPPTGKRFCMNGFALKFVPTSEM